MIKSVKSFMEKLRHTSRTSANGHFEPCCPRCCGLLALRMLASEMDDIALGEFVLQALYCALPGWSLALFKPRLTPHQD